MTIGIYNLYRFDFSLWGCVDAVLRKFISDIEYKILTGTVIVFAVTTDTNPTMNLFSELLEVEGFFSNPKSSSCDKVTSFFFFAN